MTKTKEIIEALRELRFASGLSEEDVSKLAEVAELVNFSAGTTIFTEGSTAEYIFFLRSGRVELRMCAPAQGCMTILTVEGGDLLGWSAALMLKEMTATAVTVKDTQAIRIAADQLQALCDADHDIGYEVMKRIAIALSSRLTATRLQVMDMHAQTPTNLSDRSIQTFERPT